MKTQPATFVRASISFPADIYHSLEEIAKQKKVSLAWVVRDATGRYVVDGNAAGRSEEFSGDVAAT